MSENKSKSKAQKTVVFCGGSKGGVGKSLCAGSLIDHLLEVKRDFALVDCDKANADAALWCGTLPKDRHIKIPLKDQWDPLLDKIPEIDAEVLVVNLGAGDAPLFVNEGKILKRVAEEEGWRLILVYMLSPTFGSIRALFQVANTIRPWMELWVLKNKYFPEEHWVLWDEMTVKDDPKLVVSKEVAKLGIGEGEFPLLPGRTLLEAHRPDFNGLLAFHEKSHGAIRARMEDYREAVATLAINMKI